jgi:hypothetical protein
LGRTDCAAAGNVLQWSVLQWMVFRIGWCSALDGFGSLIE